ncbi:MAG: hypothetical protein FWG55_05275 [Candidatus Bathyarchaeota archaeon]|nr:hypothetical protein [Candidatus Termiticorpusculum sp.]
MKNSLIVITIFILLCSFIITVNDVTAQTSTITIWSDGSVSSSSSIQRAGDTYVLTADLNSPIEIRKNNIILDGANHTLKAPHGSNSDAAISLKASNITVTNFHIDGWMVGIYGAYNNNTITENEITGTYRAITLYATDYVISKNIIQRNDQGIYSKDVLPSTKSNNLIISNQIVGNGWAFNIINSNRTIITQNNITENDVILTISGGLNGKYTDAGYHLLYSNNFVDNQQALYVPPFTNGPFMSGYSSVSPAGNWDNGKTGNHWSDYATRYTDASEAGNTGIGNTAYLIESEPITWNNGNGGKGETILGKAIDRYPLIHAVDTSTDSPNSSINIFNRYVVVVILVLALLVIILIVVTYRKKHPKATEIGLC